MCALVSAVPLQAHSGGGPQVPSADRNGTDEGRQTPRPNILVWMLDDVGFGQIGAFGGLIETPNIDKVAAAGLRYTNYHTAPICSASRAAMLTGRNPHSVHMGGFSGIELPNKGYDSAIPAEDGTIAANLRAAGYATFALGKWDHLPSDEMGPGGPFNHWATSQGFDHFYGFMGADTDNFAPDLVRDKTPVAVPQDPGYMLNDDLARRAIGMLHERSGKEDVAPFFLYLATGTAHAPHHAPQRWIDHYRGHFDMGWDKLRKIVLQRQIALGIVPHDTVLAPRPDGMPAWDSLSADAKKLYARQMEVFAAALSAADEQFGTIVAELRRTGELDNTIVLVTSDNGASAEGAYNGTSNEMYFANGHLPTVAENMRFLDAWGGPKTLPHYAFGWAVAGNTPFRYYKQTTFEGGTHVPLLVSWPKGLGSDVDGSLRGQFTYVADVAPTLMELAGVSTAPVLNNVKQSPMEGSSFAYTLGDAQAVDRTRAQYFELYGNKGLWFDGWSIVTRHRLQSWNLTKDGPADEAWELYDLNRDRGQTRNLAERHPTRVAAMAKMFDEQASRFNVYPIPNMSDSWGYLAAKKQAEFVRRNGRWSFPGPVAGISEGIAPPVQSYPFRMTVEVSLPTGRETGPIFTIGGHLGGMALYLNNGVPTFDLQGLDGRATNVAASRALSAGKSMITLDFDRAQARPLTPQDIWITLEVNGKPLVDRHVTYGMPARFSASDGFSIGSDFGSAVSPDYPEGTVFPGHIGTVTFQFRKADDGGSASTGSEAGKAGRN
ncbi:arylsulfatase [Novosphingobium malaysiense]|uniref:arylsulfatase n=1 Tax=Novosphingobium malaysiense TaxID=1348853 RepID=UPI0022B1B1EB|nr:arylsulfatase [Novosphingobium malaysiense]